MRIVLLFFFMQCVPFACKAQTVMQWCKQIRGVGFDGGYRIEVDSAGATYIAGNFTLNSDFDPGAAVFAMTSVSGSDGYILKLDMNGNFAWARSIGGNGNSHVTDLKTDAQGNVYLVGIFDSTIDLDPGPAVVNVTSNGKSDFFILKLDAAGNFIWARHLGGSESENAFAMDIDGEGHFYIAGIFRGIFDADPGVNVDLISPVNVGQASFFIGKYDLSGNLVWVKHSGGPTDAYVSCISLDKNNNVYFGGNFSDSVDFDPGPGVFVLKSLPFPFAAAADAYFCKLDSNGSFIWAKQIAGNSNPAETLHSIEVSDSDHVYIVGDFRDSVDFDPGAAVYNLFSPPQANGGNNDTYVGKYDGNGDFMWVKQFSGTHHVYGYDLFLDSSEHIYFCGHFWETADFDPGPAQYWQQTQGNRDLFFEKLDASGNMLWVTCIGGVNSDEANSITGDRFGNIYTTGYFHDTVDFDPNAGVFNLVELGYNWDGFIHKFAQCNININTSLNNNVITAQAVNSSFQWLLCNQNYTPIIGETSAVFIPIMNGSFAVQVSVGNCIDTSACVNITDIVGIEETSLYDRAAFPNPSAGVYQLDLSGPAEIKVRDIFGRTILRQHMNTGVCCFDITLYPDGVYLLEIVQRTMRSYQKLLKQSIP